MAVDLQIPGFDDVVEVGRGGFAVVFRAWQVGVDREVAIKVLNVRPGADVTEAFRTECVAFGAVSGHPHIVTVHDVGESPDGRPFIVMEYLHRGSVADVVRTGGPLPWAEAAEMGVEVAGALETAHRAGFLHRDVKPENVVVSRFGQAKLGDFGIALFHDSLDGTTSTTGTTGSSETISFVGSVRHAAPEVLDGRRPSVASDVYSLGSTIFTALAGRPPFGSGADADVDGLRARIATDRVPDLRAEGVPDAVCRVVEQALAKDPADRQTSAEQFGRQLQDALAEAGSPVPTMSVDTTLRPARRPARRTSALMAAVAAVVVACGVLVAVAGQDQGGGAPPSTLAIAAPTTAPAPTSTAPATTVPPPRPGSLTDDFSPSGPPWSRTGPTENRYIQQYVDGGYRLAIQNNPAGVPAVVPPSYAPISGSPAHRVHIEVDVTKMSEARADFGVICGGASSQFPYGALVDTGGWWRIVRTVNQDVNEEVRSGRDASVLAGPGPHRIGFECVAEGNAVSMTLTVDGARLGTATGRRGTSFGPGPGLLVGGLGGPVDVLFDNVALTYS